MSIKLSLADIPGPEGDYIRLLQAEIRKKDQEIEMWVGKHSYAIDLIAKGDSLYRETCAAKDAQIKDLEQQLAEQHAYIGRLEAAFLKAEAERSHYESHDVCGTAKAFMDGEGFEYNQMLAKDALEKLRG